MDKRRRNNLPRGLSHLGRPAGRAPGRKSILIVCEGTKTEPLYFRGLVKHFKLSTVDAVAARGSVPMTVVSDAARQRKDRAKKAEHSDTCVAYDEVWCVFDVDVHPNMKSALKTAKDNGLNVALTNPCFEYWLLLHFIDFGETNLSRQKMQSKLKRHLPNYEKGHDYTNDLVSKVPDAIRRAENILKSQWRTDPTNCLNILASNPSTAVHLVVKELQRMVLGQGNASTF